MTDEHRRWAIGGTMAIRAVLCWLMAGAIADQGRGREVVLAGWAEGPALSPASMLIVARAVGTAGTAHTTASHVFGDIDTGDTASFNGGAAPFGLRRSRRLAALSSRSSTVRERSRTTPAT